MYAIRSYYGLFTNKLILLGIVIQVFFSWATLYWPPVQKVLNTAPVSTGVYVSAWLGIILIFGTDYLRKRLVSVLRKKMNIMPPAA